MRDYGIESRRALGRAVKRARKHKGLSNIDDWADAVGRSTKTLRGLEAGSKVSDDTIDLVETALQPEWPVGRAYRILVGEDVTVTARGEVVETDAPPAAVTATGDPDWKRLSDGQIAVLIRDGADELARRAGSPARRLSV